MPARTTVSALPDHLGYWMRIVSNHVSHSFARRLANEDVTVAEWVILRQLLDIDEIAPGKLAARMGMTRGAISKLSDRLLAKKLIERRENRDDARAHTLSLSKAGKALVPRLAAHADENDAAVFGFLAQGEKRTLRHLLEKIIDRHGLTDIPVS